MRILITGGAGMVGSHAAVYYARKKCKVIVLDNLMRSKLFGYSRKSVEYNWRYLKTFKNVEHVRSDIRNRYILKKIFKEGIDLVIHAAAQPGVGFSINNPEEDYSINAYGTFNLLESMRLFSKKPGIFIYCSTNKVYGENVSKIQLYERKKRYIFKGVKGVSETMGIDLTGHTPYGASKYTGDLYAQEYAHMYGIKTGVFRMSCIYGTRQFGFEDQGWIAHFIISNLKDKPVTIFGNGKQVRDVLYVEDLIKAFHAFAKSELKSGVFNIGGGPNNTISLLEFIDIVEKKTGKPMDLNFGEWRPSDQKVYISDVSKVTKALKWHTKISVKEGVDKLIKWTRDNLHFFN